MKISIELLLTVIFFALKVTGATTMSWLWVFSPLWIGWGISHHHYCLCMDT